MTTYQITDLILRLSAEDIDTDQRRGIRNALWALNRNHPEGTCSDDPQYKDVFLKGGYAEGTSKTYNNNLKRFFHWLDENPLLFPLSELETDSSLSERQKYLLTSLSTLGVKSIRPILLREYVDKLLLEGAIKQEELLEAQNDFKSLFRLLMGRLPKKEDPPKTKKVTVQPPSSGPSYLIDDVLLRLEISSHRRVKAWRVSIQALDKYAKLKVFYPGYDYHDILSEFSTLSDNSLRTYNSNLNTLSQFLGDCDGIEVGLLLGLEKELGLTNNNKSVLRTMRSCGEEKLFPELLDQYRHLLLGLEYPKSTVQSYVSQIRTTFRAYGEYLQNKESSTQDKESSTQDDSEDSQDSLLDELTRGTPPDSVQDVSHLSLDELEEACGIKKDPNPFGLVTPEELRSMKNPTKGELSYLAKEVDVALRRIDIHAPFATVDLSKSTASISSGGKTKTISRKIVSRAWPVIKRSLEVLGYQVKEESPERDNFTWTISVPQLLTEWT